jgi:hypothetical protein
MSSQRAKELRALALSLSLVNDDLKNKRYLRKSEFYKESDRYKREREARKKAALNLATELLTKTPTISAALINAVHNAPAQIVGHGGDEEIKEGDIRTSFGPEEKIKDKSISGTFAEIKELSKGYSDKELEDVINSLKPIPEQKPEAKPLDTKEIRIRKSLFSELINRKISRIEKSPTSANNITNQELQTMNMGQIQKLLSAYSMLKQREEFDDIPLTDETKATMRKHTTFLKTRIQKLESQKEAEEELKLRAVARKPRTKSQKVVPIETAPKTPVRPTLTRISTPQEVLEATKDLTFDDTDEEQKPPAPTKRGRGRPRKKPVDTGPKRPVGRPRKKPEEDTGPKRPVGRPRKKKTEEDFPELAKLIKQRSEASDPGIIELRKTTSAPASIEIGPGMSAAEGGTPIVGEGLRDYMNYMKGKKPTKDMKKLILLIGSQQAGNNSYKLKIEIEKLIHKLKHDLEDKIQKQKAKSAKQQVKAVELEKRKLLIREAAKKQLRDEARFKIKN